MAFIGTGRRLAQGDVGDAARVLGIETAVLLAFLEVEAAGRGFDSQNRPKMLFEPHVFWRNLAGAVRDKAARLGLAYAKWKPGSYPKDSYPRLQQAIGVSREPAFRSGSYGLPQILGENHKAAGFVSAEAMFTAMKQGEREQLLAMVTLLSDWGLARELRGRDFSQPESWVPAVKRYKRARLCGQRLSHQGGRSLCEACAERRCRHRSVLPAEGSGASRGRGSRAWHERRGGAQSASRSPGPRLCVQAWRGWPVRR